MTPPGGGDQPGRFRQNAGGKGKKSQRILQNLHSRFRKGLYDGTTKVSMPLPSTSNSRQKKSGSRGEEGRAADFVSWCVQRRWKGGRRQSLMSGKKRKKKGVTLLLISGQNRGREGTQGDRLGEEGKGRARRIVLPHLRSSRTIGGGVETAQVIGEKKKRKKNGKGLGERHQSALFSSYSVLFGVGGKGGSERSELTIRGKWGKGGTTRISVFFKIISIKGGREGKRKPDRCGRRKREESARAIYLRCTILGNAEGGGKKRDQRKGAATPPSSRSISAKGGPKKKKKRKGEGRYPPLRSQ